MKGDFVKTMLNINGRTVLTRNSQVTLVVNKFSVAKITQHFVRFRDTLSYINVYSTLGGIIFILSQSLRSLEFCPNSIRFA